MAQRSPPSRATRLPGRWVCHLPLLRPPPLLLSPPWQPGRAGRVRSLPPPHPTGKEGNRALSFPSTGLQISLYFYSVVSTICNREKKKKERLKSRADHLGMQKIPRKRGSHCETAVKEETWTDKQNPLDQHQETCQQEKCK